MHSHPSIYRTFLAGSIVLFAILCSPSAQAADKAPAPAAAPVAAASSSAIAAGASEDSLQACLSRIPKDATSGQRMIAEQSCRRDDGDRKPFQASGGR